MKLHTCYWVQVQSHPAKIPVLSGHTYIPGYGWDGITAILRYQKLTGRTVHAR